MFFEHIVLFVVVDVRIRAHLLSYELLYCHVPLALFVFTIAVCVPFVKQSGCLGVDVEIRRAAVKLNRESDGLLQPQCNSVRNEVSDFLHALPLQLLLMPSCFLVCLFEAQQQLVEVLLVVVVAVPFRMVLWRLLLAPAAFEKALAADVHFDVLLEAVVSAAISRVQPSDEHPLVEEADRDGDDDAVEAPHHVGARVLPNSCEEGPERNAVNHLESSFVLVRWTVGPLLPGLRQQCRRVAENANQDEQEQLASPHALPHLAKLKGGALLILL